MCEIQSMVHFGLAKGHKRTIYSTKCWPKRNRSFPWRHQLLQVLPMSFRHGFRGASLGVPGGAAGDAAGAPLSAWGVERARCQRRPDGFLTGWRSTTIKTTNKKQKQQLKWSNKNVPPIFVKSFFGWVELGLCPFLSWWGCKLRRQSLKANGDHFIWAN